MDSKAPQGMLLDAVFGSEAIDSSGEILDVAGSDISDLEEGLGQINYEHMSEENEGASGNDWVGRIVFAKKIFGPKDCDNERQRKFWDELELPFIYGVVRLYDAAGHKGAQALAAIIRDHAANGEKILWRWSVEGATLRTSSDKKTLLESVVRNVALTRKPCNRSAMTGILSDPQAPAGFDKHPIKVEKDFLDEVLKRSEALGFNPERMKLGAATFIDYDPRVDEGMLSKTLSAGSMGGAPGTLTGGAALQREEFIKSKVKKALSSWDKKTPLREHLKAEVPEAAPAFIDRFADVADRYKVGTMKSMLKVEPTVQQMIRKFEGLTIDLFKAAEQAQPKPQKDLNSHIEFQGKKVKPGKAQVFSDHGWKKMDVLHGDENHFYAVPEMPPRELISHAWDPKDMVKLPRHHENQFYQMLQFPETLQDSAVVDHAVHGHPVYNAKPAQQKLVHGLDFDAPSTASSVGHNQALSHWREGAHGKPVYMKGNDREGVFNPARREVLYHNLAHDFFGLGDHMPAAALVRHPRTGQEFAAIDQVKGRHIEPNNPEHQHALDAQGKSGALDKLAMMDMINGHQDRKWANFMLGDDDKVKLLDHDQFSFTDQFDYPDYWQDYHQRNGINKTAEPMHPEAVEWLKKLDPAKLDKMMADHGVDSNIRAGNVRRLTNAQAVVNAVPNASADMVHHAGRLDPEDIALLTGGKAA